MAASKRDYYETLGVSKNADDSQLKKAYRSLVKKHHPDNNLDNKAAAEEKMKEVNEAYSVLSDQSKRQSYDQFGHSAFEQGGGGFHGGMDMGDILNSVFGGGMDFGDIFGGGGSRTRPRSRRGADLQMRITITLEEAVFGAKKTINLQSYDTCGTCKGSGAKPGTTPETCKRCGGAGSERIQQQSLLGIVTRVVPCATCKGEGRIIKEPCTTCRGQGRVRTTKPVDVSIPKGIDNGQSIRLSGKGEAGEKGAQSGDLYILVAITPHKLFRREGSHLHIDVPITFVQAALGDEISVPTLDGREEKYIVKSGTQPGSIIPMRGKGVPNVHNNNQVGDLFVKLNVTVPTQMTDKQKEILRSFNEEMGDDYKNHKVRWFDKVKGYFK